MAGFIDVINKIIKFLKNVQKKFNDFGKGTSEFGNGLLGGMIAAFQVFAVGGKSIVFNTGAIMEALWNYIDCTGEFIFKLPQCFVLHLLNLIVTLAYYIFFELPVLLLELVLGISLKSELDMLWKIIRTGDEVVYGMTGLYLTQLPPSLVKRCYSCRSRKITRKSFMEGVEKMERAGENIKRDFNVGIPKLFRRPKTNMNNGIKRLKRVFG